jgi:uncharacterized protein (DUF983 family)
MNKQERWAIAALGIAAFATYLTPFLVILTICLILAALVLGIMALVKGRIWQGILIILLLPLAAFMGIVFFAPPLY